MKKFYSLLFLIFFEVCTHANPAPTSEILRINAYPPEIEVSFLYLGSNDTLDLSGFHIFTSGGTATINNGIILTECYENPGYVFDSSNTSGFAFNPVGDSLYLDIAIGGYELFYEYTKFGNYGFDSSPLVGYQVVQKNFLLRYEDSEPCPWPYMTYEFCNPDYGYTDVMINEINVHSTWENGSNFIELYNRSDIDKSLDGWRITCDTIYDLPSDAFIPTHGYYVIDENDFPESFGMNITADNLYLITPDSSITDHIRIYGPRLIDQVGWSSDHGENVSFMRFPEGDTDSTTYMYDFQGFDDQSSSTFENGFPTRGAANRHECPGFVPIAARADSLGDAVARITWTDPIWDETYDYSVLVKTYDDYAELPTDGDIIYSGTEQGFVDVSVIPGAASYYTVFARNTVGEYSTPTNESRSYICFNSVGTDEPNTLPEDTGILSCYPNPFNAQTKIDFAISQPGMVTLSIYDITGRLIETLAEQYYPAGNHSVAWDAGKYSSGIYFAKINTEEGMQSMKMVYMK